jgi:hypothetical protein
MSLRAASSNRRFGGVLNPFGTNKPLQEQEHNHYRGNGYQKRGKNKLPGIAVLSGLNPGKVQREYRGFIFRAADHREGQQVVVPNPNGIDDDK